MSLEIVLIAIALILIATLGVLAFFFFRTHSERFQMDIGGQTPRASGGQDPSSDSSFKLRIGGMLLLCGAAFATLGAKLWSMQLISSADYQKLADQNRTRTITTPAPRGRILDRKGRELVKNRASLAVVADSSVVKDPIAMHLLSNTLGIPLIAVKRRILNSTEAAESAHTVALDVSRRQLAYIEEHAPLFAGVAIEERTQRAYPYGALAAQVLGYTGPITEEQLKASRAKAQKEGSINYHSGDVVGQAGVERQYEKILQGIRGEQQVFVDATGQVTDHVNSVKAKSGSDLVLTIDADIQKAAEAGLAHGIDFAHRLGNVRCKSGACLVMDVTNGEILAMASAPSFSPAVFIGGISQDDWKKLSDPSSEHPLLNRCVSAQYPSASTIKPLSTFAALRYGMATAQSTFDCKGWWTGFGKGTGRWCWLHSGHGIMTLDTGIIHSCDVVFYEIAKRFFFAEKSKQEGLQETFVRWGLSKLTGVDLPSEAQGRVPTPEWKYKHYSSASEYDRRWQGGDSANIVIGQGDMLVSLLQMACVYMGIATKGTVHQPHLMKEIRSQASDSAVLSFEPKVLRTVEEDASHFDLVRDAIGKVVYQEENFMRRHFVGFPVKVSGKTGTAEVLGQDDLAWLCTFAPSDKPKYVVCSVIERGGFGAGSTMFAVRDTLGVLFNSPDKVPDPGAAEAQESHR